MSLPEPTQEILRPGWAEGAPGPIVTLVTHEGRVRMANEDVVVVGTVVVSAPSPTPVQVLHSPRTDPLVLAVLDGLGGHEAGEVAAGVAGRFLAEVGAGLDEERLLRSAVERANHAVFAAMDFPPGVPGMGATIVAASMFGLTAWVANVGDARAYVLEAAGDDGPGLLQVTEDDSVAAGAQDGASTGSSAQITQCIGGAAEPVPIDVHLTEVVLDPADALVLCSDGLTDLVEHDALVELIVPGDDVATVTAWLDAALEAGGRDNISILLARPTH